MNSILLAVLGAIAAVIATFGYILFGKPKGEQTGDRGAIEQVQPTPKPQPLPEISTPDPTIETPAETEISAESEITEPEATEATSTDGLTLDTVEQPDAIDDSYSNGNGQSTTDDTAASAEVGTEEPIELNLDDATQVNELGAETGETAAIDTTTESTPEYSSEYEPITQLPSAGTEETTNTEEITEAASFDPSELGEPIAFRRAEAVPAMAVASYSPTNAPIQHAPFSILQDSKRPSNLEEQKLSQQLLTWGNSYKNASQVITYSQDPNPVIRQYVAQSLGIMLKQVPDRNDAHTIVQTLNRLSEDKDETVKAIAQSGLG